MANQTRIYFHSHRYPETEWGELIVGYLDKESRLFWHKLHSTAGGLITNYQSFCMKFLEKYNYLLIIEEVREKLKLCYYKGDISEYILRCRKLVCQIPQDKLTFFEKKYLFMDKLPLTVRQDIKKTDFKEKEDMELVYAAARESDRNNRLTRGNYNSKPNGKFNDGKYLTP